MKCKLFLPKKKKSGSSLSEGLPTTFVYQRNRYNVEKKKITLKFKSV